MTKILFAPNKSLGGIMDALGLPKCTTAFTLRVRVGQPVTLEVESCVEEDRAEKMATALKIYNLVEPDQQEGEG